MGKITKEDLFREIGEIDEVYIEEAERVRRKRRPASRLMKALAAAASLVLCVGVGYGALRLMDIGAGSSSNSTADLSAGMQMENVIEECAPAEAEENEEIRQSAAQKTAEEGTQSTEISKEFEEERAGGADNEETADKNSDLAQEELATLTDQDLQLSGSGAAQLSWDEARGDAVYGKYVDVHVPEGYSYTLGMRSDTGLHVIWNKGMEEISISCRQADESVSSWLVDTALPEEYDLSLYTIPWSDSVPEELRDKVMYATFFPERITQEIVAARTYRVQEEGDVSGFRTRISILYSDNVLVEITGKGPSSEEIYGLIILEN